MYVFPSATSCHMHVSVLLGATTACMPDILTWREHYWWQATPFCMPQSFCHRHQPHSVVHSKSYTLVCIYAYIQTFLLIYLIAFTSTRTRIAALRFASSQLCCR